MLAAATFSLGNKRQLLDCNNVPICIMEKKMISLHGSWVMSRADNGMKVAEVKPALASLTPCELLSTCLSRLWLLVDQY